MKNDSDVIDLLRHMVHAPTQSFNEEASVAWISWWLDRNGLAYSTPKGNIVAAAASPDPAKKTLALIAHLDTVPPAAGLAVTVTAYNKLPGMTVPLRLTVVVAVLEVRVRLPL